MAARSYLLQHALNIYHIQHVKARYNFTASLCTAQDTQFKLTMASKDKKRTAIVVGKLPRNSHISHHPEADNPQAQE